MTEDTSLAGQNNKGYLEKFTILVELLFFLYYNRIMDEIKYWKVVKSISWNRNKIKYVKAYENWEAIQKTRWNKADIISCKEINEEEYLRGKGKV